MDRCNIKMKDFCSMKETEEMLQRTFCKSEKRIRSYYVEYSNTVMSTNQEKIESQE